MLSANKTRCRQDVQKPITDMVKTAASKYWIQKRDDTLASTLFRVSFKEFSYRSLDQRTDGFVFVLGELCQRFQVALFDTHSPQLLSHC